MIMVLTTLSLTNEAKIITVISSEILYTTAFTTSLAVSDLKYGWGLVLLRYDDAPSSLKDLAIIAFDDNTINEFFDANRAAQIISNKIGLIMEDAFNEIKDIYKNTKLKTEEQNNEKENN